MGEDREGGGDAITAEAKLVEAAQGGDHDAFRQLWGDLTHRLTGLCVGVAGNRPDGLDALQETAIAVWTGLGGLRDGRAFRGWVVATAYHRAHDVLRARGRRAEEPFEAEADAARFERPFADGVVDVLDVRRALARLPANHRDAVLLNASGLKHAQIAELMDASSGTVTQWIHRGREALRRELDV